MINLEKEVAYGTPLFRLAFRPFFLGAGMFAVVSVFVWMLVYVHGVKFNFLGMSPTSWHAHEMIFGYAMAVIAGFLLTAIKNWTGPVSYTHLTLPTNVQQCRSRWSPYQ